MPRALPLLAVLALAACGAQQESAHDPAAPGPPPATTTVSTAATDAAPDATTVAVYFLHDGQIAAARRDLPAPNAVARGALEALAAGPTAREREAGLTTSIPRDLRIERLAVADGVADVDFAPERGCPSIAQIVYTLTQFATVDRVTGNCIPASAYPRGLSRADLERLTPPILVETPTIGERVTSPLRIRGTANTYEATFVVDVTDRNGRVIAEQVVAATPGSGDRGRFQIAVPFRVDRPGGSLVAFERSAEDGSQLHVVEIPLRLSPP